MSKDVQGSSREALTSPFHSFSVFVSWTQSVVFSVSLQLRKSGAPISLWEK